MKGNTTSSYCPDCGQRACNAGVCSNCQEELYILENQSDTIGVPLSNEFIEEAGKQRRYLNQREALRDD